MIKFCSGINSRIRVKITVNLFSNKMSLTRIVGSSLFPWLFNKIYLILKDLFKPLETNN